MANVTELNASSFEQTIAGDPPVLVDFWAEWCAPCRAIAPIVEELAVELDGRLRVAKLNVDAEPDIARRLGVMSIPTLILFAGGQEKVRLVGARGKEQLRKEIAQHLG